MQAAKNPSFATQTPRQQDPLVAAALARGQPETIFAAFDDPSFSAEGTNSQFASNYSQSRNSSYHHPTHNRRGSGGVESGDDDSDAWYNVTRTSL